MYRFDPRAIPPVFLEPGHAPAANAIVVSQSVFNVEKEIRFGARVRQAQLTLFDAGSLGYDLGTLSALLHDLTIFTLAEDVAFRLRGTRFKRGDRSDARSFNTVSDVCLFSGGTDSYSGILLAKRKLKRVAGVYCAHSDQARMIHIVREIERKVLKGAGIGLHELRVPSMGSRGYAQLRGFLYVVGSAAWMDLLQADRLLVTECGPTMYQPRFSPFDSITMTTHPVVLAYASAVMRILLGRDIEILTPFEDLTKAEVLAICPDKPGLRYTHSCISQRFGRHDGTCYGCVIRRLAAVAAGIADVHYDKNPIADVHAKAGNLMSLLVFSFDLLTRYREMPDYETGIIEAYGKQDLFRRFALDNFAAIHRLVRQRHRVRASILRLYKALLKAIGAGPLDRRLDALGRADFAPRFRKR